MDVDQRPTTAAPPRTTVVARRSRPRLRIPAWSPWVFGPLVVTVLYAALPQPSDVRSHYQASLVALVSAPALAWLLTRRSALAHHAAAAWSACLLPMWTLIALNGTDYFFAGPTGDQSFRLENAARFASDLTHLTDYTYDVPAFYSPGWFWVVGAASRVTGTPAWQAYKWVAIVSMYVAALLAFAMWRRTCGTRLAALLQTVTIIGLPAAGLAWLGSQTLLLSGAYEPYNWLVALPLPALLTWVGMSEGRFSWRRAVGLGVALGVAAWLYLLYAVVAAVGVLVVTVCRRRSRDRWREVLVAGATSFLLVLPWLGGFAVAWLRAGRPVALATTYVEHDSYVRLVTPTASPWLLPAGIGAVGLLTLRGAAHPRLRGCQAAAATVLLLGLVQALAGQSGRGVFFHRQLLVLGVSLLAAGVLTLAEIRRPLLAPVHDRFPTFPARRFAAAVLAVAALVSLTAHADEWMTRSELRTAAFNNAYPDGGLPSLARAKTRAAAGHPAGRPAGGDAGADRRPAAAEPHRSVRLRAVVGALRQPARPVPAAEGVPAARHRHVVGRDRARTAAGFRRAPGVRAAQRRRPADLRLRELGSGERPVPGVDGDVPRDPVRPLRLRHPSGRHLDGGGAAPDALGRGA
jgi:galactan 5-O-arabinofuranosyltransferase